MYSGNTLISLSAGSSVSVLLEKVKKQVEYHCFADFRTRRIDPLYDELCLIISEVFVMNPGTVIKINGTLIQTKLIQEVYLKLRNDHLKMVYDNFQEVTCHIYNKKAYLRTALYNAVFELQAYFINDSCYG